MILESREVTKKYGSKTAVNQVSLQLEPGLVYAMLGPNGSGKTTWMKMVAGLVKPTNGEILYQGTPIGKESKKEIAYMSTEPYFYNWMTVSDVGKYYEDFFEDFSMEKYRQMISRMELTEDMKAKKLSSGMMAKLKIAVTMAREARLYLLDEPLNGIDLLARDQIMKSILEAIDPDVTLVVSSHLVDELERVADAAIFMKDGILANQCMVEELRKTAFSKLVLLVITAVAEIAFLIGVFWKKDNILAMGIIFLVMCTIFGVIYIGIESVNVLHRDLNTKQSYMLFLTPKSSYQILGAKILENGISIIMAGAFFASLAAIDVTVATLYIGGLKEMINLVSSFMKVNWSVTFTPAEAAFYFFGLLASWIVFIVNADLSVILSASVLAGKKGSGIAGFLIFLVISSVIGKLLDLIPVLKSMELTFVLYIAASFAIAAVLYVISGWIMEKKLSV